MQKTIDMRGLNSLLSSLHTALGPLAQLARQMEQAWEPCREGFARVCEQYGPVIVKFSQMVTADREFRDAVVGMGFSSFLFRSYEFHMYGVDAGEAKEIVYGYVKSQAFEDNILKAISMVPAMESRYDFILSAICMHRNNHFLSSSMIASSQIEGVLNDFLVELGLLYSDGKYFFKVGSCGDICKDGKKNSVKVSGLSAKLSQARKADWYGDEFIDSLVGDIISDSDPINKFRNRIMHGDCSMVPTETESAKLLYWLSGLTLRVCLILDEE